VAKKREEKRAFSLFEFFRRSHISSWLEVCKLRGKLAAAIRYIEIMSEFC
jgi:hypothetical protein